KQRHVLAPEAQERGADIGLVLKSGVRGEKLLRAGRRDRGEKLFLAFNMRIERRLRHARLARDRIHARGAETLFQEQAKRGLQHGQLLSRDRVRGAAFGGIEQFHASLARAMRPVFPQPEYGLFPSLEQEKTKPFSFYLTGWQVSIILDCTVQSSSAVGTRRRSPCPKQLSFSVRCSVWP